MKKLPVHPSTTASAWFAAIAPMLFITTFNTSVAQYSVAPNAFVIEAPSRSTEMYIRMSNDAAPMEFELSSYFSVPGTDSLGNFKLFDVDSLRHRSISPHLRFSPRRFILAAGGHQLVRISVTSDSLPDGEYWARIVASAKFVSEVVPTDAPAMSAEMGLEIRTVSGLLYRKGNLGSDIEIGGHSVFVRNDSLFIDLDIQKSSEAAWIGTFQVELSDVNGTVAHTNSIPSNVYVGTKYRHVIPNLALKPGRYLAKVTLATHRDDSLIPLIKAPSVTSSAAFEVKIGKTG